MSTTQPNSDAIAPSDAAEWDRVMNLARNAVHDTDGRGMIGSNRNHLSQRVARAILHAERAAREIAAQPGEGYDRDLIADMLDGFSDDTCAWTMEAIREQARLLREADNREHRAQTVRLPSPPHVADALDGERVVEPVFEWRWVDEKGRAMTNWNPGEPPLPIREVSDEKGTMRVEIRTAIAARAEAGGGS